MVSQVNINLHTMQYTHSPSTDHSQYNNPQPHTVKTRVWVNGTIRPLASVSVYIISDIPCQRALTA